MTALDDFSTIHEKPFADAIARLEDLLAQGGRAFLIGAGCSVCAGLPVTAELTKQALDSVKLDETSKIILAAIRDDFAGADGANIEDYLSELIDLLAIADRRHSKGSTQKDIHLAGVGYSQAQLRAAADQIKRGIAEAIEIKVNIEIHRSFIQAVHRAQRPGKSTVGQTVSYLVLNYDTLIEDALALQCVTYADGFEGGATGWWSPETFDNKTLRARVFKLHGSITWRELPDDSLPRRIGASIQVAGANDRRILIWPASTKYRETQNDPYAYLAGKARHVLRPDQGSQCVLVICGYRFGDAHINFDLRQALYDSAGNLTMVVFTSSNEPSGELESWRQDASIAGQILVFAKRGFFDGTTSHRSTEDLPWWKFENITRLLAGER